MIETFVKRPVTTIMFVLVFVVLGIISYRNLYIELTPKVDFPFVTITAVYPGASPLEVETQVIKKIEDVVSQISDLEKITSKSLENFGFVFLEFKLGVDANIKAIEVKDKIEPIIKNLPKNIEKPIVQKFDPFAESVIDLVLSSSNHNSVELYEFADKKLKNIFSRISGVASVDIYGGKIRQININLDPNLMKKYYLSITDVISALARTNLNLPSGRLEQTTSSINVRFIGEFSNIDAISNTTIVSREGVEVKLSQIGFVEDSFKKVESMAKYNGKNAIGLSIKKITDANSVDVGQKIRKILPQVQQMLPKGMSLIVGLDKTSFVLSETLSTINNIGIGILLTVILLYIFTGSIRTTIVSSIVIPSSVISAFFLMDKSNFTINIITLLALATALGTLIANAIIIIENILSHIEKGKDSVTAAIDGTKEVFVAVIASAGTNIAVFTPIAFMGSIAGQFLKQFGLTVIYVTIFSIIASFSLTPMLCALLLKNYKPNNTDTKKVFNFSVARLSNWLLQFFIKEYEYIFKFQFRFPKITILLTFAALIGSVYLVKYIGSEFFTQYDQNQININITLPQGSSIYKTEEVVREVESILVNIPEVTSYISYIGGSSGVEVASVNLNLKDLSQRTRSDLDIINELIIKTAIIPDVEFDFQRGASLGGIKGDIILDVYGVDYDELIQYSRKVIELMENSGYFRSITSSYKIPAKEIQFIPDKNNITFYGLSNLAVGQLLRASIYGDDTNIYKENGEEYKINITLADDYKTTIDDLEQIHIISQKGLIPITTLGSLKTQMSLPPIWRVNKERIIQISGFLSKSTSGQVRAFLDKELKQVNFKEGYGYRYGGITKRQDESMFELKKAFIIAAILTYMLLAAILNSFIHPITIVSAIFTSFIGVFLFLFFFDFSINMGVLLTLVMLVGVVVNNAILLLDYAIQKIIQGHNIIDALWISAKTKFRAIIICSVSIIGGVAPQLLSTMAFKASMGIVMVGGMIASIVFTFFFIPVVFWYLERFKQFIASKFS